MFCQLYEEKRKQCSSAVEHVLHRFLFPEIISEIISYTVLDKRCFLYENLKGIHCSKSWAGWMVYLNANSDVWILSLTNLRVVHWNCAIDLNDMSMMDLLQSKDYMNYIPRDKRDKLLHSLKRNLDRTLNKASVF
jgi:hypothetical protein